MRLPPILHAACWRSTPGLVAAVAISVAAPAHAQSSDADSGGVRSEAQQKTTVVVMPFEFAAPIPPQPYVTRPPYGGPPPAAILPLMLVPLLLLHGSGLRSGSAPVAMGATLAAAVAIPVMAASSRSRYPGPYPVPPAAAGPPGDGLGQAIGVGIADLLTARLLDVPGFRVVERRRLDLLITEQQVAERDSLSPHDTAGGRAAPSERPIRPGTMLRARYIITGSITRFGSEERQGVGGVGGRFGVGGLGVRQPRTQVSLTARVIDAATGEIVASVTGVGTSTKGGSILIAGAGGSAGGGVAVTSGEFRASALGEATDRAIDAVIQGIVAKRERLGRSG